MSGEDKAVEMCEFMHIYQAFDGTFLVYREGNGVEEGEHIYGKLSKRGEDYESTFGFECQTKKAIS